MFLVEVNTAANLLCVTFAGHVDAAEARKCRERIETSLAELQPGFRLLTDLRELEGMEVACAEEIGRVMDLCKRKGLSEAVRVIPDPHKDIGFNILSWFHYRHAVHTFTCETMAEAEEILARDNRRVKSGSPTAPH